MPKYTLLVSQYFFQNLLFILSLLNFLFNEQLQQTFFHANFDVYYVLLTQWAQHRGTDNIVPYILFDSLNSEALSYWITEEDPIEVNNGANCLLNRITRETYVIPSTRTWSSQHDKACDYRLKVCLYLCVVCVYTYLKEVVWLGILNSTTYRITAWKFRC